MERKHDVYILLKHHYSMKDIEFSFKMYSLIPTRRIKICRNDVFLLSMLKKLLKSSSNDILQIKHYSRDL